MIQISNLHKRFGKQVVLEAVNLSLPDAGIFAILGPNGSGKTTLIKTILGMVIPDKGDILFAGENIRQKWAYRENIGYLPQIARFPDNLKVQELIQFIQKIRPQATREQQLIQRFGLEPFLDKRLGTLSGGTRQKVNLVLTFMYDSPLFILDEPTTGLDPVAMIELKQLMQEEKAQGKLILITTHIMDFVEAMADDILFLLEGNIRFQGSQARLRDNYGGVSLEMAIARMLQEAAGTTHAENVPQKLTT